MKNVRSLKLEYMLFSYQTGCANYAKMRWRLNILGWSYFLCVPNCAFCLNTIKLKPQFKVKEIKIIALDNLVFDHFLGLALKGLNQSYFDCLKCYATVCLKYIHH